MNTALPPDNIVFYRRVLPHLQPRGATFFVTFRLAGSLPVSELKKLQDEKDEELNLLKRRFKAQALRREIITHEKRFFVRYDELLDKSITGPRWLSDKRCARIVAEKIQRNNGSHYNLIAFSIMSNHVHILIDTSESIFLQNERTHVLGKIMNFMKGSTAFHCNRVLQRKGSFWHPASYDHYVRNRDEGVRIAEYIVNNPVQAGLCKRWDDWEFNFLCSS